MNDLHVSATIGTAVLLWVLGGTLVLLEMMTSIDCGAAGVTIATGAAVFNVRGYFCRLAQREQNAFELGREYGRREPTPIRR